MSLIQPTLEDIISHCKRRGFIFQSADIYGGLNGVYDFGHYGALIKNNLRTAWLQSLREHNTSIVLLEGSLLGPQSVWEASGHVANFHDPMIDCRDGMVLQTRYLFPFFFCLV
jgi:glycyl-tRNA synthetase